MSMTGTYTTDFTGSLWPPQLMNFFLSKLLSGSPFADSLTKLPTSAGSVVFPRTAPDEASWVSEGQPIPGSC